MKSFCSILIIIFLTIPCAIAEDTLSELIQRAGNTDEENLRLQTILSFAQSVDASESLRHEAERLAREIEKWNTSKRLDYFGRDIREDLEYDFGVSTDSPLFPLTHLYRARMLIWYALESGNVWKQPENRAAFLGKAREELEKAQAFFPENRIVNMYLGEIVPPDREYASPKDAPQWAIHQREGLERLTDIIQWWIDHREQDNHEYSGGWGDDCEMWRWWVPVLIAFDDPQIAVAQERFSTALLSQDHLKPGYVTFMTDVEHSAEDLADALTPMMHLQPDRPEWKDRALRLAELMETLWTGRNERGQLQFKSTYFNAFEVQDDPQKACDTVYHPRTIQPTLLYWQRTGDERLTRLFSDWMRTWVDAAAREERGKPAGILPSAIHWPEGFAGGLGENWWDPRNHSEPTLYQWPSAMGMMTNTLLLTYHITGDESFLQPIRSMAQIRLQYLRNPIADPAPGTQAWCANRMPITATAAKFRQLTGSDEFDELLRRERSPYMRFLLDGERDNLIQALQENAQALRINFPGYTSEVRYTDRVLRFPQLFSEDALTPDPQNRIEEPDPQLLYSTLTGDPGDIGYFPMNRVRWLTPPREIAALVETAASDRFTASLYHFGDSDRKMQAELYLLEPGDYRLQLKDKISNEIVATNTFTVDGPRARVAFTLPPQRASELIVERNKEPVR